MAKNDDVSTKTISKEPLTPSQQNGQQNGKSSVTESPPGLETHPKRNESEIRFEAIENDAFSVKTQVLVERGVWGSKMQFLLACLGQMVGLGNIVRFPYLVNKYGGGAFLVPYVICLFGIGIPLVLLETGLGQYTQLGSAHLFKNMLPISAGVGYSQVLTTGLLSTYYNIIITWIIYYFFMSFTGVIGKCGNWSSPNCTEFSMREENYTFTPSAEEFFNKYMLQKGESIEDWSWPSPGLTFCLICASLCVALMLLYGIQTSGKVVYFTATAPYVALTILLIRGLTLEGAFDGLAFYLTPSFKEIENLTVWRECVSQIIFSLGIGTGLITLASYNRFHNRMVADVLILTVGDLFSSFFAGLVVFAYVGFVARSTKKKVEETVKEGFSLVFVVLVEGIVNTTMGWLWVIVFTFMLFTLGIDSILAQVETVVTCISDIMIEHGRKPIKPLIALGAALFLIVVGLPMVTSAGIFVFTLLDSFTSALPLIFIVVAECVVLNIYGVNKFLNDIHYMTGCNFCCLLRIAYQISMIITPLFLLFLLGREVHTLTIATIEQKLNSQYYPVWAFIFGWIMALFPIFVVPVSMVITLVHPKGKPCKELFVETEQFRVKAKKHKSFDEKNKIEFLAS